MKHKKIKNIIFIVFQKYFKNIFYNVLKIIDLIIIYLYSKLKIFNFKKRLIKLYNLKNIIRYIKIIKKK